jgi:hypothetical protein
MPSNPRLAGRVQASGFGRNGFWGDWTPGSGTGASSTLPEASVCSRKGPNSSPNHKLPSLACRTDSRSKSAPVSSRSGRNSGNGTFWSGSRSCRKPSTATVPVPPSAVLKSGRIRYRRNRKSPELVLAP